MAKKEKFINKPWTLVIAGAVLPFIISMVRNYFKGIPILSTIIWVFKSVLNFIVSVLTYSIEIRWLLLTVIILIIGNKIRVKLTKSHTEKPEFLDYKSDSFTNWRWSWQWKYSPAQRAWVTADLKAHCPKCQTPLINRSSWNGLYYDCPRCTYIARDAQCDDPQKVDSVIIDNIDRKIYPQ